MTKALCVLVIALVVASKASAQADLPEGTVALPVCKEGLMIGIVVRIPEAGDYTFTWNPEYCKKLAELNKERPTKPEPKKPSQVVPELKKKAPVLPPSSSNSNFSI
jgi:hypothetical protein